jgi:diamine N-acetyltransferase
MDRTVDRRPSRDDVVVRTAVDEDVAELSALAQLVWSHTFGTNFTAADVGNHVFSTRSEAYFHSALQERYVLVAEAQGRLVGYVQFGPVSIPEVHGGPDDRSLNRLYVDTELHGRGIGRRLLLTALSHPELATAPYVFLRVWERNERAVSLYAQAGFRNVGTTRFAIGSAPAEDLVMRLDRRQTSA